jgi:putative nucleotidyltransferase with HDIG domain
MNTQAIRSLYHPYTQQSHSQAMVAIKVGQTSTAPRQLALHIEAMLALVRTVENLHPATIGHSQRVADIAVVIGQALGVSIGDLCHLRDGGLLHDIGKVGVGDSILRKTGPLTFEEQVVMRRHPALGWDILDTVGRFAHIQPIVLWHHERYDGKGYPDHLIGDDIPLTARIIAVADSFDAMNSGRAYRTALHLPQMIEIFREGQGKQWDPLVVEALLDNL